MIDIISFTSASH